MEKKVARIDKKVEKLEGRQPENIFGRQALLKDSMAESKHDWQDLGGAERLRRSQQAMTALSEKMAVMCPQEMQELRDKAQGLRNDLRAQIRMQIQQELQKKRDIILQEGEQATEGLNNHVAVARFSAKDLDDVCSLLETPEYKHMTLAEDLSRDGSAFAVPTPDVAALFSAMVEAMAEKESHPQSWWVKYLCSNRERFHGVAIGRASVEPHENVAGVLQAKAVPGLIHASPSKCSGDACRRRFGGS